MAVWGIVKNPRQITLTPRESLKDLKFDVGKEFEVLTVSFDPQDTPAEANAKKSLYVGLYTRKGGAKGWHFLTGNESSIRQLTDAVGFGSLTVARVGPVQDFGAMMAGGSLLKIL